MRFLVYGSGLEEAVRHALSRHGHRPMTMEEAGLSASAGVEEVLDALRSKGLELLTAGEVAEQLLARIYDEKLWLTRVVVYLQLAGGEIEQDDAIDRLFERYKRLTPGRLYTVTETRVKIRQLPSRIA